MIHDKEEGEVTVRRERSERRERVKRGRSNRTFLPL